MNRELQTYTDEQGRQYIEEPMPSDFVGKHLSLHNGTPVRMAVYDPSEERKFFADSNKMLLRMSDEGLKGLVAFCDYYVKEDNGVDIGLMYVHPFHRNKNISNNMVLFFAKIIPLTSTLDAYNVGSKYVEKLIENATNNKTVNVRVFTTNKESYDPVRDAFIPPKPTEGNWKLNENTYLWEETLLEIDK